MTTIICPDCGKESTFKFIPKPSQLGNTFTSINLGLSCKHEYVMINYNGFYELNERLKRLEEKLKVIEQNL